MTYDKLKNLVRFANIIGIKTTGDLMKFKAKAKATTNDELYLSLYNAALFKTKSAS